MSATSAVVAVAVGRGGGGVVDLVAMAGGGDVDVVVAVVVDELVGCVPLGGSELEPGPQGGQGGQPTCFDRWGLDADDLPSS